MSKHSRSAGFGPTGGDAKARDKGSQGAGPTGRMDAAELSAGLGATGAVPNPDANAALAPGDLVAERYRVEATLGGGGMGVVYRAVDTESNEPVALKVIRPDLVAHPQAVARFDRETALLKGLNHDRIVRMLDSGHDETLDLRWCAMELLDGQTLRAWIEARRAEGDRVELHEALEITAQLLEALVYAHEHTIHRDLKPENVMVVSEPLSLKVVDFGIAALPTPDQLTRTNTLLGTAYYMAPEQLRDAAHADVRADLYAVAVILYELLTGDVPTGRFGPPSAERTSLPEPLDLIVMQGLSVDPDDRFADAATFAVAIADMRRILGSDDEARWWIRAAGDLGADAPGVMRLSPGRIQRLPSVCGWCGTCGVSESFSFAMSPSNETSIGRLPACERCAGRAQSRYMNGKMGMGCFGFLGLCSVVGALAAFNEGGPPVAGAGMAAVGALFGFFAYRYATRFSSGSTLPRAKKDAFMRVLPGGQREVGASSAFLLAVAFREETGWNPGAE